MPTPKKILLIVAWAYNRRELWLTLKWIKDNGWKWDIISAKGFIEEERTAAERFTCGKLSEFTIDRVADYDGLVVISGARTTIEFLYYDNHTRNIVKEFGKRNTPIAAMCCAVPAIRDLVDGKTVTVFPSTRTIPILRKAGAIISDESIEIDGNIVTAKTDEITERMMEEFVRLLKKKGSKERKPKS